MKSEIGNYIDNLEKLLEKEKDTKQRKKREFLFYVNDKELFSYMNKFRKSFFIDSMFFLYLYNMPRPRKTYTLATIARKLVPSNMSRQAMPRPVASAGWRSARCRTRTRPAAARASQGWVSGNQTRKPQQLAALCQHDRQARVG